MRKPDVVIHSPKVTDRVIAAAVSKNDRTRHVVFIPGAKIIDVDPTSVSTRILAPAGEWVDDVKGIDRAVSKALAAWTEAHNVKQGKLQGSLCCADDHVYFTLKNQPDRGRDSLRTVCDITAELSDIKRGTRDDRYRLVWRVLEAEFKERYADSDEESMGSESGSEPEIDNSAGGGFADGDEFSAPGADEGKSAPKAGMHEEPQKEPTEALKDECDPPVNSDTAPPVDVEDDGDNALSEISSQLQALADKVRSLEKHRG